jgi:EAL domain-containing protein (putative c-di-GMP-specific phosphodiesterase class I)
VDRRRLAWTYNGNLAPLLPDGTPNLRAFGVDDFDVVYQPIVEAATGRVFSYEALVRCRHATFTDPSALFRVAVEQQTCGHLGRVIRHVAFQRWDAGPLFVNVHPDELSSRWFVRPDDPMTLHPHPVYLEITEAGAFAHLELCKDVLHEVCERTGAFLVVDDFGAGHSDMERVLDLRPAIVKLDASLVRGIDRDKRRQSFARRLIALCTELDAEVVAECVETVEELKAVRDIGAHYVQGYLIARPSYPVPRADWPLIPSKPPIAARSGRGRSSPVLTHKAAAARRTSRRPNT